MSLRSFILSFGRKYHVCPVLTSLSSNNKKVCWSYENSDQLRNPNTGFVPALLLLSDIYFNYLFFLILTSIAAIAIYYPVLTV